MVLERAGEPGTKACGEGLSAPGYSMLRAIGLATAIDSLPMTRCRGFCLHLDHRRAGVVRMKRGPVGIARADLDTVIAREAAREGADIRFGCGARAIERVPGAGFVVSGDRFEIGAKLIIAADGLHSAVRKKMGLEEATGTGCSWTIAMRGFFSSPPRFVHIYLEPNREIYCTPTGRERLNVSFLCGREELKRTCSAGPLEESLRFLARDLGFRIDDISEGKGSSGLGNVRHPESARGVLFVGDACESFDPLGGLGMTHAIGSALIASDLVGDVCHGEKTVHEAFSLYHARRERFAAPLRRFTRLAGILLRSELAYRMAGSFAGLVPVDMLLPSFGNEG